MRCLKPITINGQEFNCGSCLNCRINKTSMWTLRLLYELDNWTTASFVTLTYDDKHRPGQLVPGHLTEFHKALRYRLANRGRKFKYFSVGEYGGKTKREHYHLILFGLNPDPHDKNNEDRQLIIDSWKRCEDFMFAWKKSHNAIDFVNREDIQYVAGYVQKKLTGILAEEEYGNRHKPFMRCSKGLGLDYAIKNKDRILQNGYVFLNSKKIGIPRYFRDKLNIEQKELIINPLKQKIDDETNYLYSLFCKDMQNLGIDIFSNPTMTYHRFKNWYDNHMYDISKRVEKDFIKRGKLYSKEI